VNIQFLKPGAFASNDRVSMADLTTLISKANPAACEAALISICRGALTPAFGAVTKRELELIVFDALIQVGFLSEPPTVYEVMQKLRVTRGRARSLIFDRDVRRHTSDQLDKLATQALKQPLLQAQGYAVALDIENPLLADHIRETLRSLGHATDGSFSPSLVKLGDDAAGALVEHYVPANERDNVLKALHKAGVKDKSIKGAVKAILRKGAAKIAGDTGDAIAGDIGDFLAAIFESNAGDITNAASGLMKTLEFDSKAPAS
jgi:hypothetical protein